MAEGVSKVVVLGGGTAGWLSACYLAARHPQLGITLVEAPDIPTLGVGEGTWPTMRQTLSTIGISEVDFLGQCEASFKQGSLFEGWVTGAPDDIYLHPFNLPPSGDCNDLLAAWQSAEPERSFDDAMTAQSEICRQNLAPRQRQMPDYAGAANYAYHLDAGKFAALLKDHATKRLGVTLISARIDGVEASDDGDIAALVTQDGAAIEGDFFIDCSGQSAFLIGQHYAREWVDLSQASFNDRALVVQAPVAPDSPIASQTIAHAHEAGWIWDIALPTRRGIGCVYSARFMEDERAEEVLRAYLAQRGAGSALEDLTPRLLRFAPGHRREFWYRNCLAIGQAAGFIEPLEASAIVMVELSLRALADNFPRSRRVMDIHARRFNALFTYRWNRVVDFLKLHYVLSQRDEPYWAAQRDPQTLSDSLSDQLVVWRDQPPSDWDLPYSDEIFSDASQQFVLYGMGFPMPKSLPREASKEARHKLEQVRQQARSLSAALPTGRAYIDNLALADSKNT